MRAGIPPGAKRIAPGVYGHNGEMHIDAAELLEAEGIPPTRENMEQLERAAARVVTDAGIPYDVVDEP